jgi:hypothetical protein
MKTMEMRESTLERINQLASERMELYKGATRRPMDETERRRVETITLELERLWDQLRRERAARRYGPVRPTERKLFEQAA